MRAPMTTSARAEASPEAPLLPPAPPGASLAVVKFDDLPGWTRDDHAAAFRVFLASCRRLAEGGPDLRPGAPATADLVTVCRDALKLGELGPIEARRFFEERFTALRITPESGRGFLTGYYEPE